MKSFKYNVYTLCEKEAEFVTPKYTYFILGWLFKKKKIADTEAPKAE